MVNTTQRAEIHLEANGTGEIYIDGLDLSNVVSNLELTGGIHEPPPILILHVPLTRGVRISGEFETAVSDDTRVMLLALGWTPPRDKP